MQPTDKRLCVRAWQADALHKVLHAKVGHRGQVDVLRHKDGVTVLLAHGREVPVGRPNSTRDEVPLSTTFAALDRGLYFLEGRSGPTGKISARPSGTRRASPAAPPRRARAPKKRTAAARRTLAARTPGSPAARTRGTPAAPTRRATRRAWAGTKRHGAFKMQGSFVRGVDRACPRTTKFWRNRVSSRPSG